MLQSTAGQLLKTGQVRQKEKGRAEARGWEQPLRRVLHASADETTPSSHGASRCNGHHAKI
jgi:hypothetical protein